MITPIYVIILGALLAAGALLVEGFFVVKNYGAHDLTPLIMLVYTAPIFIVGVFLLISGTIWHFCR